MGIWEPHHGLVQALGLGLDLKFTKTMGDYATCYSESMHHLNLELPQHHWQRLIEANQLNVWHMYA